MEMRYLCSNKTNYLILASP